MDRKLFSLTINQISEEKNIPREEIMKTIEAAIASAYRKDYGKKSQVIRVKFNEETGDFLAFQIKKVVEDEKALEAEETPAVTDTAVASPEARDEEEKFHFNPEKHIILSEAEKVKPGIKVDEELEIELPKHSDFGRIAAQTAKQVVIQRIREAERSAIFGEFKKREGDVVTATVQRLKPSPTGMGSNVIFDIGRTVGILFPMEQIPSDRYNIGARFKVYISKVEEDAKGPRIVLSRISPELVKRLFVLEIPEIASGVIEVRAVAREAGSRTKIAVSSAQENVDPIGACVGQRGIRVQTIMGELGGEKIDIIKWNANPEFFIINSLSPAKVLGIRLIEGEKRAIARVAEDQFSLAIGKQGQNVRLAARLTGWKIDVVVGKPEEERPVEDNSGDKKKEDATVKTGEDTAVEQEAIIMEPVKEVKAEKKEKKPKKEKKAAKAPKKEAEKKPKKEKKSKTKK